MYIKITYNAHIEISGTYSYCLNTLLQLVPKYVPSRRIGCTTFTPFLLHMDHVKIWKWCPTILRQGYSPQFIFIQQRVSESHIHLLHITEHQKSEVVNILTIVSSGIDGLDVEVVSIGIIRIHCSLIVEVREYQYHHYLKIQQMG